jgi:transposase-like protein
MEDYPKTLLEFAERFATEEACREYLFKLRWPQGFECPRCKHQKAWSMGQGLYRCVRCRFRTSVTAGTIFQDSKKPLRLWFWAMWHLTSQKYGANAHGLQQVLDLGIYRTAWFLLHKLRRAMVRPRRDRLSGTVEVDETYIGGERPGKCGRGAANKVLVVVAVEVKENRIGRIRLRRVPNTSAESLEKAIKEAVEPGSTVHTDGLRSYNRLSKMGYIHEVVREEAEVGKNLLPSINRVVALLKRWLLGTYQGAVQPSHLDYYLDEYTFRFNRRASHSRGKLFYRLIQQAAEIEPVLVKSICGGCTNS